MSHSPRSATFHACARTSETRDDVTTVLVAGAQTARRDVAGTASPVADTCIPVGLGKISVKSRTMVIYIVDFLYYIYVQKLSLTIVRQASTS